MGSTQFMITLSVLLIAGAVVGVAARRRAARTRSPSGPAGLSGSSGSSGPPGSSGLSDLDAEVEANHWLIRLGGGLVPPDARAWAGAEESAGRALTSAAECHRVARTQLAGARTATEYGEVTRVAREGLEHLRVARAALGLGPAPVEDRAPGARRPAGAGARQAHAFAASGSKSGP
ncbi:hypothetical protein ACFWBB_12455 [Streptomyces sp. NPDC060000]|uniref:hypothetical protein n=1 Tax=Streptomyces sp. NPDC060000 TaxID=3347031 RepID=UPI003691F6C1